MYLLTIQKFVGTGYVIKNEALKFIVIIYEYTDWPLNFYYR